MFATLLGPLPRPPLPADATPEALVRAAVAAQEDAGLEPITDGGWWGPLSAVEAWRRTAAMTDRAVKAVVVGPWTAARGGAASTAYADVLDLAAAGCPLIEIHEPDAAAIGADAEAWKRFAAAQVAVTSGLDGTHLSLAITGGAADPAGLAAILAAPYASLAVDLIAGPENWRLVRALPGDRGVVCGALSPLAGSDDGPETLLWAAAYAASSAGRGRDRVGIATASSLAGLSWDAAVAKIGRLGAAAALAMLPADELRARLDPRSIDARSAALGSAGSIPPRSARRPGGSRPPT